MSVIPCRKDASLQRQINAFAETLKTEAYRLGDHGLDDTEFYQSGIFRGAIERLRGQFAAARSEKRDFVRRVLNHLQDLGLLTNYDETENGARNEFIVTMPGGTRTAVSLKGCLDGNNTNVFERPPGVDEFVMWSLCTNLGADPRRNAWSGIHTRLSAEMIERGQRIDGVVIWDWICGTVGRPCPKLAGETASRTTEIGPWRLTPPCLYLLPSEIPSPSQPCPPPRSLDQSPLLAALHQAFAGRDEELNLVTIELSTANDEVARRTTITRAGEIAAQSDFTVIRRRGSGLVEGLPAVHAAPPANGSRTSTP